MSKLERLQKRLIKNVIVAVVIILVCGGIYFAVDDMSSEALQHQTEAEGELSKNQNTRNELQAKIDAAAQSEKKYLELLLSHTNPSFEAKREDMLNFLREVKTQARLNDVKVTLNPETVLTEMALTSPNHEVTLRDDIAVEFGAMSDLHVYHMLSQMQRQAPGFVRLKAVTIDLKNDLTPTVINRIAAGETADVVNAKITLSWAGIRQKDADQLAAEKLPSSPVGGPSGSAMPPGGAK